MRKRILSVLLAATMLALCFAGCKGTNPAEPTPEESGDSAKGTGDLSNLTIGACVMSLQHEFMINLVEGYNEFQKQTNVKLLITDGGNMEPEKQVTNVENYIAQDVDGILAQCISIDTMRDTLNAAYDAGIPTGYYPHADGIRSSTYFGYDEYVWGYELGEEASTWIKEKLDGKCKIINLQTSLEQTALERARGWQEAINKNCGEENIEWVIVEATSSEDAISAVESALQANPDAKMVLVFNDEMGIGAYEAVAQSGLDTSDMFVGSCDGTDAVLDLVERDTVYRCTVANDRFVSEIGFYWVQNIVKCALGMDYEDPFPITTMAVTIDSVKDYRAREASYVLDDEIVEYMKNN